MDKILKYLLYLYPGKTSTPFYWECYCGIKVDYINDKVLLIGESDSRWGDESDIFVDEMPEYQIRAFEEFLKSKAMKKAQIEMLEEYLEKKLC